MVPHLDDQTSRIDEVITQRLHEHRTSGAASYDSPILANFNHLLHELRTIELRSLDLDGGVMLSAGCAGLWYFDWIRDNVSAVGHHIGVELYEERPDGLAADVIWLSQSASAMTDVADRSVDMVFSGQNIEHLPIEDMTGFLTESNRVLRPGGTLVVDSPNRLAVEALQWIHPEHTVEISADEAVALVETAGFAPRRVTGVWNCRDRHTRRWLPLAAEPGDVAAMLERAVGERSIDDDFVWWLEAERVEEADHRRVREAVVDLFDRHWTDRINRAVQCVGERSDDGTWRVLAGSAGMVYATERFPLFAGVNELRASHPQLRVRAVGPDQTELGTSTGALQLALDQTVFGVRVELVADRALTETLGDVHVTASQPERSSAV